MINQRLRKYLTPLILIGLLIVMTAQMVVGTINDSATADEPIHLLSGYTTLTQHHILFDPEHPFLVKAFAALPLLILNPQMPPDAVNLSQEFKQIDYNSYYQANDWGWQLLFNGRHDAYQTLYAARAMMILLTLALVVIVFWLSKQLFGTIAALFVAAFVSLDPNLIAHGHLINTDIGASLFFVGTLATFWKFLHHPSLKWLVFTGIMLGLGMLTKFSLGMLAIILPLLTIAWLFNHRHQLNQIDLPLFHFIQKLSLSSAAKIWAKYITAVAAIGVIALTIIWLGYGTLMLVNPVENPWQRPDIVEPGNTLLSALPPTYAKGIANIVAPNRQGYLLGQCFEGSRWDYFPLLSIFKTPLTSLALIISSAVAFLLVLIKRQGAKAGPSFTIYFFAIPTIIYLAISGLTGINIGIRHILPIYILALIAMGSIVHTVWHSTHLPLSTNLQRNSLYALVLCAAIVSFLAWPYYLPYYNYLAHEPQSIPYVADDSNTDWGQGTKTLAEYVKENNINSIAFDNFISRAEADYLNIPYTSANPNNHDYRGYLAISRSTITNHMCQHNNDWGWVVNNLKPTAILAGAINIYYLQ